MISAFLMHLFCILLRLIYLPFKALRPRNKVVFISRQGNQPSMDFLMLAEELKKQNSALEVVILCRYIKKGLISKILYAFHMLRQMYHLATSKACVLDGYCIAACVLRHHKQLKIYQLWHAVGLLKNFGYAAEGLKEGSSSQTIRIMRMHRGYHRIMCSSEKIVSDIARCYDAEEERFMPLGLPRVDFLTDPNALSACREKILKECPALQGEKQVILYAPTFRRNPSCKRPPLEESIDLTRYHLIKKSHGGRVVLHTEEGEYNIPDRFSGVEWIAAADYVVSDYSAILFEALAAGRPVALFCYDLEDYGADRGFAIDYHKIPLPVCVTADQVAKTIEANAFDHKAMDEFCGHYVAARSLRSTAAIGYLIAEEMEGKSISFEEIAAMPQFQKQKEVYHV
ncbi:MAG: CDP-glycerol glycerophosphotransferase family protein [Clostridia bacterium]|nr:CDP-glycerol glycerophosphotransferase family protein [Clostridia bacterium]